jgi:DNA-binding FadR family transcriptional regulator
MIVAQRIVGEITEQGIKPGEPLPSERAMLEGYGVARGTLREALRFLEIQGVLSIKPGPGGGPSVNAPDARSLASSIALLLQLSGAKFSDILDARLVLEPPLAALAADRADEQEIAAMRDSVTTIASSVGDFVHFFQENKRFHGLIACASKNRLFEYLVNSLGWITDGTALGVDYSEKRRRAIVRAHERIVDAIAERDRDRAEDAMRSHIQEYLTYLEKYYPDVPARRLSWGQVLADQA